MKSYCFHSQKASDFPNRELELRVLLCCSIPRRIFLHRAGISFETQHVYIKTFEDVYEGKKITMVSVLLHYLPSGRSIPCSFFILPPYKDFCTKDYELICLPECGAKELPKASSEGILCWLVVFLV